MSLTDTVARADGVGNGSVTDFTFSFKIYTKADLEVLADGVVQTLDTHYTVREPSGALFESLAEASLPSTGFVRFLTAPANLVKLAVLRKQPVKQESEYQLNEDFPSGRLEKDLDKLAMVLQQMRETLGRAPTFGKRSLVKDKTLPDPTGTPKVIGFDGANNLVLYDLTTGQITGMVNVMSALWDLIVGGAAGVPARLPVDPNDTVLSVVAGALGYRLIPTASLADGVLSADAAGRLKMADNYITAPKITDGQVLAAKFRRFEGSAENAGAVTVTSGGVQVVTLDLGTVVLGDRIFIDVHVVMTKGGTGGVTEFDIQRVSGTGTVQHANNRGNMGHRNPLHDAATILSGTISGVFKVTTGGTLVLEIRAFSFGSDGTISPGDGELYAWVIPGS